MLESRRGEIDSLVSFLRVNYAVSTLGGLEQVAKDNGIRVIRARRTVVEFVRVQEGIGYVFIGPSLFPRVKAYGLAHELGHVLIDQTNVAGPIKEVEAEYFARSLVGSISDLQLLAVIPVRIAVNPLGCLRYLLDSNGYDDELVKTVINRSQKVEE